MTVKTKYSWYLRHMSGFNHSVVIVFRIEEKLVVEITAEVQGNYASLKQNFADKENLVVSKVSESQLLFGKFRFGAVQFEE